MEIQPSVYFDIDGPEIITIPYMNTKVSMFAGSMWNVVRHVTDCTVFRTSSQVAFDEVLDVSNNNPGCSRYLLTILSAGEVYNAEKAKTYFYILTEKVDSVFLKKTLYPRFNLHTRSIQFLSNDLKRIVRDIVVYFIHLGNWNMIIGSSAGKKIFITNGCVKFLFLSEVDDENVWLQERMNDVSYLQTAFIKGIPGNQDPGALVFAEERRSFCTFTIASEKDIKKWAYHPFLWTYEMREQMPGLLHKEAYERLVRENHKFRWASNFNPPHNSIWRITFDYPSWVPGRRQQPAFHPETAWGLLRSLRNAGAHLKDTLSETEFGNRNKDPQGNAMPLPSVSERQIELANFIKKDYLVELFERCKLSEFRRANPSWGRLN